MSEDDDPQAEARRNRGNIAALIVIVALVAGSLWLYSTLKRANDVEVCAERGLRNCSQQP